MAYQQIFGGYFLSHGNAAKLLAPLR